MKKDKSIPRVIDFSNLLIVWRLDNKMINNYNIGMQYDQYVASVL